MADLSGLTIAATFDRLLALPSGGGDGTTHVALTDGDAGTTFPITLATDALMITSTNRLEFGTNANYVYQVGSNVLGLVAGSEIDLTATAIDINGTADVSGTLTVGGTVTVNAAAVFNEGSGDYDFRVEGNGNANLLFCDAGNDTVGIGTATPSVDLEIVNNAGHATLALYAYNSSGGDSLIKFGGRTDSTSDSVNGDFDWGIGTDKSDSNKFNIMYSASGITTASASQVLTITTGGAVGIGTITPTQSLDITKDVASNPFIALHLQNSQDDHGDTNGSVSIRMSPDDGQANSAQIVCGKDANYASSGNKSSYLSFHTILSNNMSEVMRLDSNGRVGIGTAFPSNDLSVHNATGGIIAINREDADNAITDTNALGQIIFGGDDPTNNTFQQGAAIVALAAGTWASTDCGADLVFKTCTDGANSLDTRMSILDNGNVLIHTGNVGIAAAVPTTKLDIWSAETEAYHYVLSLRNPYNHETNLDYGVGIKFQVDDAAEDKWCAIRGDAKTLYGNTTEMTFLTNETKWLTIGPLGDVDPATDGTQDLGHASAAFDGIWVDDADWNGSDERIKENIEDSVLGLDFVNRLRPVSYKKKDKEYVLHKEDEMGQAYEETHTKTYKRTHYGLIAQEVKGVLDDLSIDTEKFAGYADGNLDEKLAVDKLFLRYTEFIAPMMKAIQELSAKVEALENA